MDDTNDPTSERLPLVELVASVRGLYNGAMVEPGTHFMWDPNTRWPGGRRPLPQWAAPVGQQAAKQPKGFDQVDIRPPAAAKAAAGKARAIHPDN
jgi:hypothetical protein